MTSSIQTPSNPENDMTSPRRFHLHSIALTGFAVLSFQHCAFAGDASDDTTRWGLGIAGSASQLPYADDQARKRVLPLLYVENDWLKIAGTGIDLKLPSAGPVTFALRASYSFDGYKTGDAPVLDGMAERKHSVWVGGVANWHDPIANVSVEWLADASNHSNGEQARIVADHGFEIGALELRPRVSAQWVDGKYVDYYFGVRPDEVTPTRDAYGGKSTVNLEVGTRASYRFSARQTGFVDVTAVRLGDEIADSPLVGRRTLAGVTAGYLFTF
jgi:outer membrane protein